MESTHPTARTLVDTPGINLSQAGNRLLTTLFAVLFASALGLCLRGYQLGTSNQAVYLIDALRRSSPDLLRNDWWVNHTLQYHIAYSLFASALHRAGLLAPVFLVAYMLLVLLFNYGWYRLVKVLGGSTRAFLLSVLLFYFSAAGTGLGMYSFFQDSSFLPSNLANVALLWGLLHWVERRRVAAGLAMGIAGFFHLNHALVVIGGWAALGIWDTLAKDTVTRRQWRDYLVGGCFTLGFSLFNIIPAARAALTEHSDLPLRDFIELYVRLRHPHHYDPSTWPIALWITFIWPIPFAIVAWKRAPSTEARRQAARIFVLMMAINMVALIGAGLFYVSGILVQMSLYRFSIYPKLLSCIGAAYLLADQWPAARKYGWLAIATVFFAIAWGSVFVTHFMREFVTANTIPLAMVLSLCAVAALFEWSSRSAGEAGRRLAAPIVWGGCLMSLAVGVLAWKLQVGLFVMAGLADSPDYLAVCDWVKDPAHTPVDAILLVPPHEQEMRLRGQRAIVVDFKCVPHLPAEIVKWRQQLCDVLDLKTLDPLPRRMDRTLIDIRRRYSELPAAHLVQVARQYGAQYVITEHPVAMPAGVTSVFEQGTCHVYLLPKLVH